ncbi:PIG-L deacetylase family protein [Flexithrix dorotheae]|uniref:PIG-L deacetylase family protein n=1 Tax=Flexithrix dorotheae TaxID=70993 RepID=UPI00035C98E6|nr:PIG-L family deacetylase [Flexithrix dorotheae]
MKNVIPLILRKTAISTSFLKAIFISGLFLFTQCTPQSQAVEEKVLMAVFAHPDDEISVGPLLAKYANEGVKVYLVIVTDGRLGTGRSGLPSGEGLVELRKEEAKCAAERFGIEPPIHLGFHDQLDLDKGFFGHTPVAQELIRKMDTLFSEIQPDAIITWGPDGGSNHVDHRLVGATVTHVFLSKKRSKQQFLYYYGQPASIFKDQPEQILRSIDDQYLTTKINYNKEDLSKTLEALSCYQSQFGPEVMEQKALKFKKFNYSVYLRPFMAPTTSSEDIFH